MRMPSLNRRALMALGLCAAVAGPLTRSGMAPTAIPPVLLDPHAATSAFPHYWEACVGSDHTDMALRAEWQRDLATVHQRAGFRSVRFQGLFDDDVGLCKGVVSNGLELNFFYLVQIFDTILALWVKPFIELGFMPKALASSGATILWYRGNTSPPRDMALWSQMIALFLRHLIDRYGAAEVRRWRFEVWNEPNLVFWAGSQQEYFDLYAATARALKSVDAQVGVGGPANAQMGWIPEFLAFCAQNQVPVDFVSSHIYADDMQAKVFGKDLHLPLEQVIPRAIKMANAAIAASAFPHLPLVISEWTSQNPAFIAQMVRDCAALCDTFSFWMFDNVFEERGTVQGYDAMRYGIMNHGGVARSSMHAFEPLHCLGDERLPTGAAPMIATRRKDGSLAILAWNLVATADVSDQTGNPMYAPGAEPVLDGPDKAFSLAPPGQVGAARMTVIDIVHDAADLAYAAMGRPPSPTPQQLAHLQAAGALPAASALAFAGHRLGFTLPANAVALIEVGRA